MGGSPAGQATGTVSLAYMVLVSVQDEGRMREASEGLKPLLRQAVEDSDTGRLTGARVTSVNDQVPPPGSGHVGWGVGVTAVVDLDRWNAGLGPGQSAQDAADHIAGMLRNTDISSAGGASVDDVKTKLIVGGGA